jgi:hypothetical protein
MKKLEVAGLFLACITLFGLVYLGVSWLAKQPVPVYTPTAMDICLEKYDYETCKASEVCGGIENIKKITTGGFFEIGKGFECKERK